MVVARWISLVNWQPERETRTCNPPPMQNAAPSMRLQNMWGEKSHRLSCCRLSSGQGLRLWVTVEFLVFVFHFFCCPLAVASPVRRPAAMTCLMHPPHLVPARNHTRLTRKPHPQAASITYKGHESEPTPLFFLSFLTILRASEAKTGTDVLATALLFCPHDCRHFSSGLVGRDRMGMVERVSLQCVCGCDGGAKGTPLVLGETAAQPPPPLPSSSSPSSSTVAMIPCDVPTPSFVLTPQALWAFPGAFGHLHAFTQ